MTERQKAGERAERGWVTVIRLVSSRWWLGAGFAVLSILALVQTARLSAFIETGSREYALFPWDAHASEHWCAGAYFEGARYNGERHPNIYDHRLYTGRKVAGLVVDEYEYPPQFLLIARAARSAAPEVTGFRARWFVAEAGLLAFALALVAFWLRRPVLAVIVAGLEPFQAFFSYPLPRVLSGEAFPNLDSGRRVATNISLFSLPFRLKALGPRLSARHPGARAPHLDPAGAARGRRGRAVRYARRDARAGASTDLGGGVGGRAGARVP